MKRSKKGFTLAELLVVVAIIAVLVAIAIPVFGGQVEKAAEAADLANIRAAYAEASVKALDTNASAEATAEMTQGTAGWDYQTDTVIGGYSTASGATTAMPSVKKGDTVKVTVTAAGVVTIAKVTTN